MRFFAFILATIVLGQSWVPCKDDDAISMTTGKSEILFVKSTPHQNHSDHNDNCSPFCHCACCAGFSIHQFFTPVFTPLVPDDIAFSSYSQNNLVDVSSPVWQPPQLIA